MFNVSEIQVSYKPHFNPMERPQILGSNATVKILRQYWQDDLNLYESSYLMLLNTNNRVLGLVKIGMGTVDSCQIDNFKVLQIALKANAKQIIVAHNHPSGNIYPSEADKKVTKSLCESAKLMRIKLLDHIILTENSFYSFAEECML